jgi:hypothetical protein
LLFSVNAFAETKEISVDINQDYTNAVFYISWDNVEEKGTVEVTAPDGKVYSKSQTSDDVYEANGEAIVSVGQVAKGTWNVKVTGTNLGTVKVDVGQLPNSMVIDEFSVNEQNDKYMAKFSISDCPEEVSIEIYADYDSEGYDGNRVYSGNNKSAGEVEINLDNLKAGEYHFYIIVSKDGAYKRAYSNSVISKQNKDSEIKVQDVVGGKYNDGYYISWTNEDEESEYEKHTVYVWDADMNLIFEEEVEGDNLYYGEFDDDSDKVYLAVVSTDSKCNYDKIEVSKDASVEAEVVYDVDDNVTNHTFITADVSFQGKCTFEASLNDALMLEDESEAGKYKISMSDGNNTIIFLVRDEDGNVKTFTKDIYVDTVPPALSVSEDLDNMVTSKNYVYVSGYSEAGATLTLNGKEVTMKKGYFNEKVSLEYGKNTIKLVAEDVAGNKSVYTATVDYEMSKSSRNKIYIYAVIIVVLVIVYMVVFIKGIRRRKKG